MLAGRQASHDTSIVSRLQPFEGQGARQGIVSQYNALPSHDTAQVLGAGRAIGERA